MLSKYVTMLLILDSCSIKGGNLNHHTNVHTNWWLPLFTINSSYYYWNHVIVIPQFSEWRSLLLYVYPLLSVV